MIKRKLKFDPSNIDERFVHRHIAPSQGDQQEMLNFLGYEDMEEFLDAVVPNDIQYKGSYKNFDLNGCDEITATNELLEIAKENQPHRSLIGLGYHGTEMPAVIKRHVFENPSWYTAYTPYQSEIAQGRLEALFNFQTLISELTGLPIVNASLLDEATAAAEAMSMSFAKNKNVKTFLVDHDSLPQTIAVLKTRAEPLGIRIQISDPNDFQIDETVFGVFLQIPGISGRLVDPSLCIKKAKKVGASVIAAIDPLMQVLVTPIGDLGVDVAIGSIQRFGVPCAFGGPHAAFFATRNEFKRLIPGRVVGESIDQDGEPALRLALQTREQHIRRDKATSNICTAQVLLAVIASFYAIYHGAKGLNRIASGIVFHRKKIEHSLLELGYQFKYFDRFDSIDIYTENASNVIGLAEKNGYNLRVLPVGASSTNAKGFGLTLDELTTDEEILNLTKIFAEAVGKKPSNIKPYQQITNTTESLFSSFPVRTSELLTQVVFNNYRSETELLRYIYRLSNKDFTLVQGMIPLGSCTMKLNAVSELIPIGWHYFSNLHPFAPKNQVHGYFLLFNDLEKWLSSLTGFAAVSFQPNAGSQGEFAGLLVIREWHRSRRQSHRNICLIPTSAHGTNPASAVMAGMSVVPVDCDIDGNIDINDLNNKAEKFSKNLSALMITYPSTHGVFEPEIKQICKIIHMHGGQVYLDGANFNAQVGLCRPIDYGADVCHLNLHKTFCIPHGGGGPGMGPIAVANHLKRFLPDHPFDFFKTENAIGTVSAAPFGSAGILPISWMYLRMMGIKGLRASSAVALLSANYLAKKLDPYFPVLFKGVSKLVAHECILDLRPLKNEVGIDVEDIAKRLMDYGFHSPTVSWPVNGTLMVEPTESEGLEELDRFCNAMISINIEIQSIKSGKSDPENNPLKRAPHTISAVLDDNWDRPYSREVAAFPLPGQRKNKFWPAVSRIRNAQGDRNLICTCAPMEQYSDETEELLS